MIIRIFLILILLLTLSFSKDFTVASYNVENFFDLKYDKTEYKEFIPNTKSKWTKESFEIKLNNLKKVLNDLDKDIVALQEIESKEAFLALTKHLPKYKYHTFEKYKNSSIGLALISKYPIIDTKLLHIKHSKVNRPILKVILKIENQKLIIFNNHWPSKRNSENQRILYAQTLQNYIKELDEKSDYIILGDLNSNYNETETFRYSKLNNTYNLTGINDILQTSLNNNFIKKNEILEYKKRVHYNLWLEKPYQDRFSYKYKNDNQTPDNILLPKSMFDNENISYVNNSFEIFKPPYLFHKNKIYRWQMNNKVHQNRGFSDHLPIFATFSTNKQEKIEEEKVSKIEELYANTSLKLPSKISNIILLYKHKDKAVVKQLNSKAILIYKNINSLNYNTIYELTVNNIKYYNGLLEINNFIINSQKREKIKKEDFYLDAKKHDILDIKYQNEIIFNIEGLFKDNFLYYKFENQDKRVRVYSKDKTLLPKNGQKITIINAHLGFYKSNPQINIYKKSDYIYAD